MKRIGILLAALAVLKIGIVDHLHRTATKDALVTAYGRDAIAACQKTQRGETLRPGPQRPDPQRPDPLWGASNSVRIEIGDRRTNVALWQVDHQNWQARFRRTYVVLDASGARCHFDVATGSVKIEDL